MRKDRKSGLFDCSEVCCDVVEMRRMKSCLASFLCSSTKAPALVPGFAPLTDKIVHRTILFYRSSLSEFDSFLSMQNKKSHTPYDFFVLVEMRRIELLSENIFTPASTSVDCVVQIPLTRSSQSSSVLRQFLVHDRPQNKSRFTFTTWYSPLFKPWSS